MKNSEMQTRKILNYLYGNMNHEDKNLFESELKTQKELQIELLLQHDIDKALRKELKIDKFKASLNKIHESNFTKKESPILNLQNKWYWAAASITIFSGTAIYSLKNHFQNPQHLFDSYYQIWQPSVIVRGLEEERFEQSIIKEFENANFSKVIEMFEEQSIDPSANAKLLLLKGCAEMEVQDYNAAIETFNVFNSKDYTFYTEAGQWYQALCYLKNEDLENSKQILKKIIDRNTSYAKEAHELLKKLN